MVTIWFEPHGTTVDNEAERASGWDDAVLSAQGLQDAEQMATRRPGRSIKLSFASDLQRSFQTASIAMGGSQHTLNPHKVFVDWRLRECDYGEFTHKPKELVHAERLKRIDTPFPGGESYKQCMERMKSFLDDLRFGFDGKTVLLVGHRATHTGLDHWILGKSLESCLTEKFVWQPGWRYTLQ